MRKLQALLAALVVSGSLQLAAQESIPDKCQMPSFFMGRRDSSFMNQPLPEQLKIPDLPKTARQVSCFTSLKKDSTMFDVVKKCGLPDQHAGSGVYIFIYYMNDCSTVNVGTPDLERVELTHIEKGKSTFLFDPYQSPIWEPPAQAVEFPESAKPTIQKPMITNLRIAMNTLEVLLRNGIVWSIVIWKSTTS
jgi:hypothetical protein